MTRFWPVIQIRVKRCQQVGGRGAGPGRRRGPEELRVALSRRAASTRACVASRCWVPSRLSGPSSRSSCAGGRSSPALLGLTPGARRSAATGGDCCSSSAGGLSPARAIASPGPAGTVLAAREGDCGAGRGAPWCPAGLGPLRGPPGLSWARGCSSPPKSGGPQGQAQARSRGCRRCAAPRFGGGRRAWRGAERGATAALCFPGGIPPAVGRCPVTVAG